MSPAFGGWARAHGAAILLTAMTVLAIGASALDNLTMELPSLLGGLLPGPVAVFPSLMCAVSLARLTHTYPLELTSLRPLALLPVSCAGISLLAGATTWRVLGNTGTGFRTTVGILGIALLLRSTAGARNSAILTTSVLMAIISLRPATPSPPAAPVWAWILDTTPSERVWAISIAVGALGAAAYIGRSYLQNLRTDPT